jgi:HD-GYP domain-containing protein (c-di-GMP phosphodiesterase class II)
LPEIINLRKPPFMDGLMGQALRKNQAVSSQDVQNDPHMQHWNSFALEGVIKSATAIPFRLYGKIYGFLNLYASDINFFLGDEEMNLLDEMSLGISFALDTFENEKQRVHAENEIVRQLQRIHSLRKIDLAILGNNNIHQYLRVVLKQLESMLEIDAADLFLFDDDTKLFKYIAGYGFLTKHNETSNLLIGQDIAGKAAIGQKMKYIPNLQEFGEELKDSNLVNEENFIEYYAVPLNNNGNVSGVLEIFNRKRRNFVKNELDFLMSLSEQVAIAIEKYQLLTKLQIALDELTSAYDRTIEGWSNALDLRDKETEGHTIRVTQMTLELARYAGFSESDLIHIKRGALLHDIGKMGIPDHILLKPGKLTDEEWEMMRKHPQFAYDLLSPITYLQPALDIPYYHHEKWDGSGYPKGLKGEQIPLAARLFSIIDVWDALTSDRPYRPARSKDETLRYIQSMSGSHFDPYVVKIFMEKKVYEIEIEI